MKRIFMQKNDYLGWKKYIQLNNKALITIFVVFLAACEQESIRHEQDMRPIQFKFVDDKTQSKPLRMDIPYAYLRKPWRLIAKKETQPLVIERGSELQIKTIFPELTPHPQSFGVTGKYKQGLYIYVYGIDKKPESFERALKSYKKEYQLMSRDYFDFHQYEVLCSKKRCIGDDDDYLISGPDFVGEKIIGRCYKPDKNPGGGCSFVTKFKGKTIRYIFRVSELEDWREIDAHVRTLLNRFVVE